MKKAQIHPISGCKTDCYEKKKKQLWNAVFAVPASFSSQKKGCCTGFYPCATALFVKTFFQNQLKNWSALS